MWRCTTRWLARHAQVVNFATADAAAAFAAFSNKTEPVFTGEWAVK
jgi:hypothetical protein